MTSRSLPRRRVRRRPRVRVVRLVAVVVGLVAIVVGTRAALGSLHPNPTPAERIAAAATAALQRDDVAALRAISAPQTAAALDPRRVAEAADTLAALGAPRSVREREGAAGTHGAGIHAVDVTFADATVRETLQLDAQGRLVHFADTVR